MWPFQNNELYLWSIYRFWFSKCSSSFTRRFLYILDCSGPRWAILNLRFWLIKKSPAHNCRWRASHYGKNIWSFWYKNLLFHKGKQDQKWSSGVPYCSLLLIWWKDRKLSKKNNEIVSLRSNPQDKEHFCLPNTKTGLKPCGFASRKVVWQKSITSLFWCLEYFIS